MKKVLFIIAAVFVITGCEKSNQLESIAITPRIETHVGYESVLHVYLTPVEAKVPGPYLYRSSDEYVASVGNDGVICCHHVGTCTITVTTADNRYSSRCQVIVKAKNNLYKEPLVGLQLTSGEIKAKETRKNILYEDNLTLVYQENTSPAQYLFYLFDEEEKLEMSGMQLTIDDQEKLVDFLTERYNRSEVSDDTGFLKWQGKNAGIAVKSSDEAYYIIYTSIPQKDEVVNTGYASMMELIRSFKNAE